MARPRLLPALASAAAARGAAAARARALARSGCVVPGGAARAAVGELQEVVVDQRRLLADLAGLAHAAHLAALLAQPADQRCEVRVGRGDDDHVGPLGHDQVQRVHRQRDVGGVLARGQVHHRPDRQALEQVLVLDRALRGAVGAAHVKGAVFGVQPGDRLLDDVGGDVVGVDQQHHAGGRGHASVQVRVSPARSGLITASPKGRVSGSVRGSRRSVTVPVLRGRP